MTLGKNFRLPLDAKPTDYRATMRIDLGEGRFAGSLEMAVDLRAPRDVLHLHAVELDITDAVAVVAAPAGERTIAARDRRADAESETVTLAFAETLPAGAAVLKLSWAGKFSPGLRGLYRAGGLAVTQFEAADARRVFPCFDEPAFKARWSITLDDVPAGMVALSNGAAVSDTPLPSGKRRVVFAPTPPMSSYLVALIMGDLSPSPTATARGVAIRTLAVPSKRHLTAFAQEAAAAVLPRLEDYFGLPYAFGKLDQIGVPDFEAGAMENAGAITFREVALLLDVATAPLGVQKRVAEVITHELAHQWFGNLVTMVWWDDLWLNEAFATWMAYKIVADWRPDWRIWMDFEVGKGSALLLDALQSAHPIRADVHNAEEAGESFDAITYEKGGAVLRMIEGFLGEDAFRAGIRLYMSRHREANATADDLWGALAEASGQPIVALANGWIRQVGYPLVTISAGAPAPDGVPTVTLAQRRFFADPDARESGPPTRWLVPVVLRFRDGRGIQEQPVLLREGEQSVRLDADGPVAWCVGNAQARGFYRTAYDAGFRRQLGAAFSELEPAERMGLVSDQWALVRARTSSIEEFLDLVEAIRDESDHFVLDEVVNRLSVIEHRHLADQDRARFHAFVAELFAAAADRLGWPASGENGARAREDDETRLRRAALLRATVLLGRIPAAISEAERRFAKPADVDPNLLDVVVTAAARRADGARFEELRRRAQTETDPAAKRRYLHALGRVEDPALIERAVDLALLPDVPMQDFTSYLNVLLGNPVTRDRALALVVDRWEAVRAKADSPMLLRRLVEALGVLPTRQHLATVEAFLAQHPIESAKQATAQTLERMRMDVTLREQLMPQVAAWLSRRRPPPAA
ncbi:MAG TPA: M1 family metallopeptidase [Polyangia bacterium]|nr:M1 family metallopeptidase [Polyangia bacterium]